MICATCSGSGKFPNSHSVCSVCAGRGSLPDTRTQNPLCPVCSGSGKFPTSREVCPRCGGWGRLPDEGEPRDGVRVIFVERGTPRDAHLRLQALFGGFSGTVRVCDPYYGSGSLLRLDLLIHCTSVRFLTRTPDSRERLTADRAFFEYRAQHANVEFKKSPDAELHDRFVLTEQELVILGHGLKDIGRSDSFVIKLSTEIAGGVLHDVREAFDRRWDGATAFA